MNIGIMKLIKIMKKNNSEVFKIKRPKIFNERAIVGSHECWYESHKAPIFDDNENPKIYCRNM